MSKNPYLKALGFPVYVFFVAIFIIVFLALYVDNIIASGNVPAAETVAENVAPPGTVYPRQGE